MPSTSLATWPSNALSVSIVLRLLKVSFTDLEDWSLRLGAVSIKRAFYFAVWSGNHLLCSDKEVVLVFLPPGSKDSNYSLHIAATATVGSFVSSTVITTQVCKRHAGPTEPLSCLNSHVIMVNVCKSSGTRCLHRLQLLR